MFALISSLMLERSVHFELKSDQFELKSVQFNVRMTNLGPIQSGSTLWWQMKTCSVFQLIAHIYYPAKRWAIMLKRPLGPFSCTNWASKKCSMAINLHFHCQCRLTWAFANHQSSRNEDYTYTLSNVLIQSDIFNWVCLLAFNFPWMQEKLNARKLLRSLHEWFLERFILFPQSKKPCEHHHSYMQNIFWQLKL